MPSVSSFLWRTKPMAPVKPMSIKGTKVPPTAKAPKAVKPAAKTASKKAAVEPKTNEQHPEPGREAVPTFRADMGEGLPDQKDTLNPNRAK